MKPDALLAHCCAVAAMELSALRHANTDAVERTFDRSSVDAVFEFVRASALVRGVDRAERLTRGLQHSRRLASPSVQLDWSALSEVQSIVLGEPAGFRLGPAYAKRGVERYGYFDGLQDVFQRRLRDVQKHYENAAVRAALVYLDICFFHPFTDGNARAALLAADHVLALDGHTITDLQFLRPVEAGNADDYWDFIDTMERCVAPRSVSCSSGCEPQNQEAESS